MENGGKKGNDDLYKIMGLKKECSSGDLRKAYKKLAMRWHPDRCSASKNEEAKSKFQAIQQAYSVLSDTYKRFMYDVGVREEEEDSFAEEDSDDNDDEEVKGMGDFLCEMADIMSKTKPNENKKESFEELQRLFNDMFGVDADGSFGKPFDYSSQTSSCFADDFVFCNGDGMGGLKRDVEDMLTGRKTGTTFGSADHDFCFRSGDSGTGNAGRTSSYRRGISGRIHR